MTTTLYTIKDYVPGIDVPTHDPDVAEEWSRKGHAVTAVTSQ